MTASALYPNLRPSLLLDFANSRQLDPRITFIRSTTATYYDGVTTAKAEENLLTYSQEFDNASWTKGNVTVTANSATIAPDGTTTADLFYPSSTGTWRIIYKFGIKANIQNTLTVYAKASGFSNFFVGFDNQTTTVAWFNLTTGVKGTKGANITSSDMTSVGNGWYRCQVVFTHTSDSFALFGVADADNSSTATASGTNGALIWGAQAEQRSSATAYTATTTQAITNYIPKLLTAGANQPRFDHNPTTGESLGLLIEEQRTNLCLQSEDFNNGWTASTATVSNATIAPNGTLTANKIIPSSTGSNRGLYRTFTASGATTVSFYAKYGGYQWFNVIKPDGSTIGVSFDILNGVKGTEQSGVTGTITSVGNGWYRCTCTQTYTGTAYVQLGVASADNSNSVTVVTNDVFSGVFVWGAQAETSGSSFATSYIPTVASSVTRNADTWVIPNTHFTKIYNFAEFSIYLELARNYATAMDSTIWQIGTGTGNIQMYQYRNSGYVYLYGARNNHSTLEASISTTTTVLSTAYAKIAGSFKTNNFNLVINSVVLGTDTTGQIPTEVTEFIGGNLPGYYKKIMIYPILVTNAQLQALTS